MSARDKVTAIFRELAGEKAERLDGALYLADVNSRITAALTKEGAEEAAILHTDKIGFHLVDWQAEAAFIVALSLYPERFTDEEIQEGVEAFLFHAPAHVVEAARLAGFPIDTFAEEKELQPNEPSTPRPGKRSPDTPSPRPGPADF
jgi:hypothetical protein